MSNKRRSHLGSAYKQRAYERGKGLHGVGSSSEPIQKKYTIFARPTKYENEKLYENNAYVLDYFSREMGSKSDRNDIVIIQLLGDSYFTLLEATSEKIDEIYIGKKISVGKENREIIDKILGRIKVKDLSDKSRERLEKTVKMIVDDKDEIIIDFVNNSKPINRAVHVLHLIGISNSDTIEIIYEKEKSIFRSLTDLSYRLGQNMTNKIIVRI